MTASAPPDRPFDPDATALDAFDESPSIAASLLGSRQRWRDLAMMGADLAFETDIAGRFTFIAPDHALGWAAATLLGQPADRLLAGDAADGHFNPFRPMVAVRKRRTWIRRPDGGCVCVAFASAPLLDREGQIVGTRGIGQDVSEQDGHDAKVATALRRGEVLDHILWRMRQEVLAPRMMQAALESISTAMGLEGAGVIDMTGDGVLPTVLHQIGAGLSAVLHTALTMLEDPKAEPQPTQAPDGRLVLVCPCQTRFGEHAGLVLWRAGGRRALDPAGGRAFDTASGRGFDTASGRGFNTASGRAFDPDDMMLASSATGLIRVILEHDSIQREMARQAHTDPLTGLINRRAFFDEVARRLERLEHDREAGTLMFIDLDHFKQLNDSCGHDLGDEALCLTAAMLRGSVRPQDLVARLGGDEFALWLDNTDEFSAAERAERLRIEFPPSLAHLSAGSPPTPTLSMSIGIATRWPGRGEDVEALVQRADQAMYQVKRSGRGHWRVAPAEPG